MVACYNDDSPPPPALSMAWQCKQWQALPDGGGIYDQDAYLLRDMTAAMNVYNAMTRWYNLPGKRIHELTDSERGILRVLRDMGLMFNG